MKSTRWLSGRVQTDACGFTLIELLVTVSIIALLVALMMPALRQAKAVAHLRICQSNLRQIHLASHMYAQDNRMHLPDIRTLGGYYYRQAPGTKTPGDPGALPERFGLAATLDDGGYMDGNSEAWICDAQPDWMREWQNTYMYSTSSKIAQTPIDLLGRTAWVWDNYLVLPYTTGFYGGPGAGWLLPSNQRVPPHRVGVGVSDAAKRGCNYVYTDGSVIFQNEAWD